MPTESGYSNQKKKGIAQFKTIQNVGSSQHGAPIAQKTLFDITAVAQPIVSVTQIYGTDGQVQYWNIEITTHGASENDVLRMITGTLIAWEYHIVRIVDADNFYILPISDTPPIAAETAKIMRWITTRSDSQGSQTVTTGPTSFLKDAVATTVSKDTVTPGSSEPFPIEVLDVNGNPVDWTQLTKTFSPLDTIFIDFSATPVDDTTYTQIIASVGAISVKKVNIFMSSGEPLILAFGAAAAEVDKFLIFPGGNGVTELDIPAATRLSVKAKNAATTVITGNLMINLLG